MKRKKKKINTIDVNKYKEELLPSSDDAAVFLCKAMKRSDQMSIVSGRRPRAEPKHQKPQTAATDDDHRVSVGFQIKQN